jgi:hypothetical protein
MLCYVIQKAATKKNLRNSALCLDAVTVNVTPGFRVNVVLRYTKSSHQKILRD